MPRRRQTPLERKYAALGFSLSRRQDIFQRGLVEAICEHGVGHPIPENVAAGHSNGIHGCDGCCARFSGESQPDDAA